LSIQNLLDGLSEGAEQNVEVVEDEVDGEEAKRDTSAGMHARGEY